MALSYAFFLRPRFFVAGAAVPLAFRSAAQRARAAAAIRSRPSLLILCRFRGRLPSAGAFFVPGGLPRRPDPSPSCLRTSRICSSTRPF